MAYKVFNLKRMITHKGANASEDRQFPGFKADDGQGGGHT